ncbi:MAG: hypothetical protein WC677_02640 [Clostridia bacterium]|jgi:hypothetical protein
MDRNKSNLEDIKQEDVVIDIKGKSMIVSFNMNALAELEERYGDVECGAKELEKGKIKDIRTFLWAALLVNDDNLTEKDVGKLIDITNIKDVVDAINKSFFGALPDPNETPSKT